MAAPTSAVRLRSVVLGMRRSSEMDFHDLPSMRRAATAEIGTSSLLLRPMRTPLALLAPIPSLVL